MKVENIKFKAKRLDNGEWIEGEISHLENTIWIVPIDHKPFYSGCAEVDSDTICMFTGLKDCEGNEIWEGDILEGESKSEVVYTKGTFTISFIGYNKRVFSYPLCYYIKEDGTVDGKVIGNKFDKEK